MNRIDSKIAYFFESGHSSSGRAYNFVAQKLTETGSPLTFAGKTDVRLLQAADLLAWQTAKFVKDRLSNARPPRRDFLSLMEHPHTVAYASIGEDGEFTIAFELWPLSRRSQHTTAWTMGNDGPIKHMFEGDDKTPILLIERSLGWRAGGGQMVYLGFRQLGDQEFVLAFDEPRLIEAVGVFLSAFGAYPNGKLRPILPVQDVRVEAAEGGAIIAIRLPESGELGFYLSEELAKKAAQLLSGGGQG